MRFGQSTAEQEAGLAASGSGSFMKYMKQGDNTFQIIDEYDNWTWFWEHYNPGGFPFPCTGERDTCPGCTSDNERMAKASRRASFNAFDGEYTNVWKIPKSVAEKLKNRLDRLGTLTDRPYRITQIKNAEGFYDYDIEGETPVELDMSKIKEHLKDPEELLAAAYEEAWGSSGKAASQNAQRSEVQDQVNAAAGARYQRAAADHPAETDRRPTIKRSEPEPEPEEKVYSEAELRQLDVFALLTLCDKEGLKGLPDEAKTPDQIVDWMLTQVS